MSGIVKEFVVVVANVVKNHTSAAKIANGVRDYADNISFCLKDKTSGEIVSHAGKPVSFLLSPKQIENKTGATDPVLIEGCTVLTAIETKRAGDPFDTLNPETGEVQHRIVAQDGVRFNYIDSVWSAARKPIGFGANQTDLQV